MSLRPRAIISAVLFISVEQAFAHARDSGRLDAALERWRDREDAFAAFASVADLVGALRREDAPWGPKNAVTVALCELARQGDEDAKLVLTELYMPALWGLLAEFRGSVLEPEDLEAEIVAGFWATGAKITSRTPRPPARLRWGTRDHVVEAIKRAWATAPEIPVGDLEDMRELVNPASPDPAMLFDGVSGASEPLEVLVRARDAGVLTTFEAALIALTRFGGRTVAEAGVELGSSTKPTSLEVARLRAEARVVAWTLERKIPPRRKASRGV